MLSATMGVLGDEGALTWDTKVKDVLPNFHIRNEALQSFTIIIDLLPHRTGMSATNCWLGSQNNVLITKEDSLPFLNNNKLLSHSAVSGSTKNLGYKLAGLVIGQISGQR